MSRFPDFGSKIVIYVVVDQVTAATLRHRFRKRADDDFEPFDAIEINAGMVKWFALSNALPSVPAVPIPMRGNRYQCFTWIAGPPYWGRLQARYPDAPFMEQVGRFHALTGIPVGVDWVVTDEETGAGEYQGTPNVPTPTYLKRVLPRVKEYDIEGVETGDHQWGSADSLHWVYGASLEEVDNPASPGNKTRRELWDLA